MKECEKGWKERIEKVEEDERERWRRWRRWMMYVDELRGSKRK